MSDEEDLPAELRDIMQKEKQKKAEKEEEGPFPQSPLERRKKVQERKSLLSPKLSRRSEQPASPPHTKDESEEVKRLTARVEELELVSAHTRTQHHTRTHTHVASMYCTLR